MKYAALNLAMVSTLLAGCHRESTPAPSATAGSPARANADSSSQVQLESIELTPPAGWERKQPGSEFVSAEFLLPRADGDGEDGRLTISTAGGSVESNLDRWKGQFEPPPQAASPEEVDVAGLKVTVVDYSGEFNDQRGPFAPGVKRPNYRMIGAVIPARGQLHFIKATGPQNTIAKHAEAIREFIHSVKTTR
jgi:hypothetical protein